MSKSVLASSLALASLSLATETVGAQDIFCWKDEAGVPRCSDTVPPDQSRFDRDIRNDQGIVIRFEQGEITDEERAEIAARIAEEEERRRAEEDRQRYDQFLLDSFLSVADIERQRDRIIDELQGQIVVTELYLSNLTRNLDQMLNTARRYAPYSDQENAPPMPENLSLDIQRTESSISNFEQRLTDIRANQSSTRNRYETDISRFRQLKGD